MMVEGFVGLTGASLSEGGWRERSNVPEPPLGGGSGEPYVRPKARDRLMPRGIKRSRD